MIFIARWSTTESVIHFEVRVLGREQPSINSRSPEFVPAWADRLSHLRAVALWCTDLTAVLQAGMNGYIPKMPEAWMTNFGASRPTTVSDRTTND